jgi:outer membrane protein assembly factor BamD
MLRPSRGLFAVLAVFAASCGATWLVTNFPNNEALYRAAFDEFKRGHFDNAQAGFEKLTTDLPVRDTLLARSYWYLGRTHQERGEYLLAAQAFSRLVESFPDDSLGPRAALESARSYRKLWPKLSLDATYGETALETYTTVLALYSQTAPAIADSAQREIAELEQWFATKTYESGMFYFRNKAFDSGIIYFKDVLARWPQSPRARDALLRMAESYKAIHYKEDATDACAQLRKAYPSDRDVSQVCRDVAQPVASSTAPPPPKAPPR